MAQQHTTGWAPVEQNEDVGGYEHLDQHTSMYAPYQSFGYQNLAPYGHGHYGMQNTYSNMDFQMDGQQDLYPSQYPGGLAPAYDASQYTRAYQNIPDTGDHQGYMSQMSPQISPPSAPVLTQSSPAVVQQPSQANVGIAPPSVTPAPAVVPEQKGASGVQSTQKMTAANDAAPTFSFHSGKPGDSWQSVRGVPNLFIGKTAVPRQDLPKTVKKNIAGDNRNGTRLVPLLPGLLPCEILRNQLRPLTTELDEVKRKIKSLAKEGGKPGGELEKLNARREDLEKQVKGITDHGAPSKSKKQASSSKMDLSEEDSDSSEDSSDEEEDTVEVQAQKIMAASHRPIDPFKGIEYDVVKMMRGPAEKDETESKLIYRRVTGFANYIAALNAKNRELREEKAKAPKTESARLQTAINENYEHLRAALDAAVRYGDEQALKNMGTFTRLMSNLTSILTRQFGLKNYTTALPMTLLQFFSMTTFMNTEIMQKVKLAALLESNVGQLNERGKLLVNIITTNAEENSPKKPMQKTGPSTQSKSKPSNGVKDSRPVPVAKTTSSPAKTAPAPTKATSAPLKPQNSSTPASDMLRKETKNYAGLVSARKTSNNTAKSGATAPPTKRPRDDDVDSRVAKKVAVETESGNASIGKGSSALSNNQVTSNGNGITRPRPSTVLSKPRTAAKPAVKKVEKADARSAASSVSSTISGLLNEIARPPEKPKRQEEPVRAPETPEEKARRLRKEARKGRTVRWKSDNELEQIRYFERDAAEDDEGRASNMIRDARDNRLEGQMLKQMQRNMHDGDEEEEDGNPEEVNARPWVIPTATDLSSISDKQRDKNYVTRGGKRAIDSQQKQIMDAHENRELMSIYTTFSEIPFTPKSPPLIAPSATFLEPTSFSTAKMASGSGLPPNNDPRTIEIHRRWAERDQYGAPAATQFALDRLRASSPNMQPSIPMTQEDREAGVLELLTSTRMKDTMLLPQQPSSDVDMTLPESDDPETQRRWNNFIAVVEQVKKDMARPNEPPQWLQQDPARAREWLAGKKADSDAANRARLEQEAAQREAAQREAAQREAAEREALRIQASQANSGLMPDDIATILQQVQTLSAPVAPPQPAVPQMGYNLLNSFAPSGQPTQVQPSQAPAQAQDATAAWNAWAQSQAQAYGAAGYQMPDLNNYLQQYLGQAQQAQAPQQAPQSYNHYPYEGAKVDEQSSRPQNYQPNREDNDRGNRKDFHRSNKDFKEYNKGINRALIGTKPCMFWAEGRCTKGDKCTFRHDPNDLNKNH